MGPTFSIGPNRPVRPSRRPAFNSCRYALQASQMSVPTSLRPVIVTVTFACSSFGGIEHGVAVVAVVFGVKRAAFVGQIDIDRWQNLFWPARRLKALHQVF